jgi:hypothetical protein
MCWICTFWLPDLDHDQKLIQNLNIGHTALLHIMNISGQILRPKIAKVAKETMLLKKSLSLEVR